MSNEQEGLSKASVKAIRLAEEVLEKIGNEDEWEKIISLIVGNLSGHAYIMIRRHEGEAVAKKWVELTESVRLAHIDKDPDSKKEIL